MLRSIIIDDESQAAESLRKDLAAHCPGVEVIAVCNSAKEGILAIKKNKPDLIFLDIEMPWMNGFEMLDVLDHIDFSIIFTTAYDQFAAKAFRTSAVDYLLKPIHSNDLQDAVRKAAHNKERQNSLNITNLLDNLKLPSRNQKIALPNKDGYEFIEANQIVYCQAEGAYTKVFVDGKKSILISKTLETLKNFYHQIFFSAFTIPLSSISTT